MKKYVLVKYANHEAMFVLHRQSWEIYKKAGLAAGHLVSEMIAESDDEDELVRFKKLTEEKE